MDSDAVVAIVAIVVFVGLPMLGWIVSRVFAHRERIEMIRHGFIPPPTPYDARSVRRAMRQGMPVPPNYGYDPFFVANLALRRGISVALIGAALLIGLSFIGYSGGSGRFILGPWLLGGIVPMFVGIAQIVTALMNGARFGTPPRSGASFDPSRSDAGAAAQTPYAWRADSTTQTERPVQPPDVR